MVWLEGVPSRAGSPPRVRGKVSFCAGNAIIDGITPACAGKSVSCRPCRTSHQDHPRVCGEKLINSPPLKFAVGSPPRVRGKVLCNYDYSAEKGITPACAGKRCERLQKLVRNEDHPRVCGEKCAGIVALLIKVGSPPRVRGKDNRPAEEIAADGITPACAGKSSAFGITTIWTWDHPRVCGEKNDLKR